MKMNIVDSDSCRSSIFSFETVDEAMRNNTEYQQLTKTLYKLQTQRVQAVQVSENMVIN